MNQKQTTYNLKIKSIERGKGMKIAKNSFRKRMIATIMTILMVFVCIVPLPEKETAAAGTKKITEVYLGYDVIDPQYTQWTNAGGIIVYFGHGTIAAGDDNTTTDYGIPFNVLEKNGDTYLLDGHAPLSAKIIAPGTNNWTSSNIYAYLRDTFYDTSSDNASSFLSKSEKALIQSTALSNETYYYDSTSDTISATDTGGLLAVTDEADNEYVYSMSLAEYINYYGCSKVYNGKGYDDNSDVLAAKGKTGAHHFLRSQGNSLLSVYGSGKAVDNAGNQWVRICPAMHVSLNSDTVRFTKVAGYDNGDFKEVSETASKEWTLALADGNNSFTATAAPSNITKDFGGTVSISVGNVTTGENASTQISGMLVDSSDTVLYYGKIGDSTETSIDLDIPDGLAVGNYTLYVFSEKIAGYNWSSYASNMVGLPITVKDEHKVSVEIDTGSETASGELIQSGIVNTQNMDELVISAKDGYFFEDDFADMVMYQVEPNKSGISEYQTGAANLETSYGIKLEVVDNTELHITGKPNCSLSIKLPEAHLKYGVDISISDLEESYIYGDAISYKARFSATLAGTLLDTTPEGVIRSDEIKYYSTNEAVATVNEQNGSVTIKAVGTFKIKIKVAASNFHDAYEKESEIITVVPKDLTGLADIAFAVSDKYEYNAKEWKPVLNVSFGNIKLVENKDYILNYPDDMLNVGKKSFGFSFIGNFTGMSVAVGEITDAIFVMPDKPYVVKGTKGDNEYYNSKVTIVPAEGYLISASKDGTYGKTLTYSESISDGKIYLKNAITGAVSDSISVPDMLIDTEAPSITGAADGNAYYGESINVVIEDLDLVELKINDEAVEITGNKISLELSSNKGKEKYVIWMKDAAGNENTLVVDVMDEWTKLGYVPENKTIRLTTDEQYMLLDEGKWTISGDDTVYSGGIAFYVNQEGEYIFTQE